MFPVVRNFLRNEERASNLLLAVISAAMAALFVIAAASMVFLTLVNQNPAC